MLRAVQVAFLISVATAVSVPAASWHRDQAKARAASEASAAPSPQDLVPQAKDVREPAASQLRAGTVIKAELQSPIDSQNTRVSDQVVARVSSDVQQDNQTFVHRGDRLIGRVVSVQNGSAQGGSAVTMCFDRLVTQHSVMPLHTVLTAAMPRPASEIDTAMASPRPMAAPRRSPGGLLPEAGTIAATGSAGTAGMARPAGQLSPIQIVSRVQAGSRAHSSLSTAEGQLHLDSGTRLQFEVRSSEQTLASK